MANPVQTNETEDIKTFRKKPTISLLPPCSFCHFFPKPKFFPVDLDTN